MSKITTILAVVAIILIAIGYGQRIKISTLEKKLDDATSTQLSRHLKEEAFDVVHRANDKTAQEVTISKKNSTLIDGGDLQRYYDSPVHPAVIKLYHDKSPNKTK